MNVALWIAQGLLAAVFLLAGTMKLTQAHSKLSEQMGWPGDFSPGVVKLIGGLEVAGAVGLVLPALTGVAPILTPIAAVGLAVIQALAVVVHLRRNETQNLVGNLVFIAALVFIAWGRFGDYSL